MRCKYCFYADEMSCREIAHRPFMTNEFFSLIIEKAVAHLMREENSDKNLSIGFQGGEPTLSGIEFFRSAVKCVKEKVPREISVLYFIQTNGILLDEEWAEFLKENNFLVGISLDGPSSLHDKNRVDSKGSGTHKRVRDAALLLRKYGCEFNILTVVTRELARHPQQLYSYYKNLGFKYQQYIPCISPLEGGETPFSLSAERYGDFLCRIFDLWYDDFKIGKPTYNREFENYIRIILGLPPEECGMAGICSAQYLIESDGSVYPCDFYAIDDYFLGNLSNASFSDIDSERERIGFVEESKKLPPECKSCPFFALCRGGCKRNREENGKNRFCTAYKKLFTYALPKMQSIAKILSQRR